MKEYIYRKDGQLYLNEHPLIRLAHAKAMIDRAVRGALATLLEDLDNGYYHNLPDAEAHLIRKVQDQLEDVDEGDDGN